MVQLCRSIAESARFQNLVTIVILIAGVIVGLETSPAIIEKIGGPLHFIDKVILAIFTVEALTKIGAEGRQPWRYFRDPWNVFDLVVVTVSLASLAFSFPGVTALRLIRTVRCVPAA